MKEVIREILFYYVAFVATANNKFIDIMGAKDFEEVPKDWAPSYLNHRFRLEVSLLADASTKTACKDDRLH